jgi:hypothetical protein
MDFFLVPTVTARLLYVLVVMNHERRKIVHFNITGAPTATWTAQQRRFRMSPFSWARGDQGRRS